MLRDLFLWCTWIVLFKRNRLDPWFSFPDCQLFRSWRLHYKMTLFSEIFFSLFSKKLSKPKKIKGLLLILFEKTWKNCLCLNIFLACWNYQLFSISVFGWLPSTSIYIKVWNTAKSAIYLLSPRNVQLMWGWTQMTFPWTGYLV